MIKSRLARIIKLRGYKGLNAHFKISLTDKV